MCYPPRTNPPPTALSAEVDTLRDLGPCGPDVGSDALLYRFGLVTGVCVPLRERALYLPEGEKEKASAWPDVEVRFLWGKASFWEVPATIMALRKEMEEAKEKGLAKT